jgi:DNA invertase Pin-like site-specific DNA recombinase
MTPAKAFSYIRFSSSEQARGRSHDRQTEGARTYADRHNLDLDERTFKDLGVSAFRGRNIQEGALGLFLEAVREGAIPKGSYLLVESLDRVSRQTAYDAANTMRKIVEEGITVVDLSDSGRVYSREILSSDPMAFLMMIVRFMRANEESQRKSERIADTWKKKRVGANNNVPMTSNAPAWLKLNADKKSYSAVPDRALIVKRIFDEAASGLGMYAITKRLNEKKVKPFGRVNGWRMAYVAFILKNRAVLGELQPHRYVDGKRIPVDENGNLLPEGARKPIKGYYPQIIDEELFDRVQRGLFERRNSGATAWAGRKGKGYTSLFSGLMKCGRCGAKVVLHSKGTEWVYLVCDHARSRAQCQTKPWRYQHFEHSVLYFLSKQIDLQSIVSVNREQDRRYLLDAAIEAREGRIIQLNAEWKKWSTIADKITDAYDDVAKELDSVVRERKIVASELEQLTKERDILINEAKSMAEADIKALVETLDKVSEDERYKVRSDLASGLKKLVSRIDINFDISDEGLIEQYGIKPGQKIAVTVEQPNFWVTFKNGNEARCYPSSDNAFDQFAAIGRDNVDYMSTLEPDFEDPDKAFEEWLAKKGYDTTDIDKAIEQATKDTRSEKTTAKPKKSASKTKSN